MYGRITCANQLVKSVTIQSHRGVLIGSRCKSTVTTGAEEWDNAKPYDEIPGPKPLPFVGNMWRFLPIIGDLVGLMEADQLKTFHEKYGNIMKLTGIKGRNEMVFIFDPDDIEKVFRNEGPWPIRDAVKSAAYYRKITRRSTFEGVGGLALEQGEGWHKFRTKVNQTMMQPRSTRIYTAPIDAVASDFIDRIRLLRKHNQEMPADFDNELFKWALESIVYIALDTRLGCLKPDLEPNSEPQKMIEAVQVQFDGVWKMEAKLPLWKIMNTPTWNKFVKSADYFAEVSMKYIYQAMERMKTMPEDSERELTVLEKLLARDPDPKTAMVMALDMMTAGVDTTSYSTAAVLYYLAKNPEKQDKLFQEIYYFLPNKDQPVTSDILNELKYLKACIKESLRISPITTGNQRQLVKDMVLAKHQVPKGTDVIMPFLLLSNMDKYYPQAKKFIPERWMKGAQHGNEKTHPFVTLPFGFGPRMCIGRRFAELEIETVISKIIRNFRVEYNHGEMKFRSKLLYTPASSLKFKMVDRNI